MSIFRIPFIFVILSFGAVAASAQTTPIDEPPVVLTKLMTCFGLGEDPAFEEKVDIFVDLPRFQREQVQAQVVINDQKMPGRVVGERPKFSVTYSATMLNQGGVSLVPLKLLNFEQRKMVDKGTLRIEINPDEREFKASHVALDNSLSEIKCVNHF